MLLEKGTLICQKCVIYMDNLFSASQIFSHLQSHDSAAAGTVRSNAAGFPKSLAIRGKKGVHLPCDTLNRATRGWCCAIDLD